MRNWIIVALILLVVGLIGAGKTFSGKGMLSFGTEKVNIDKQIGAEGVTGLKLDTGSTDVEIVKGGSDRIEASLTGRASKKYIGKLTVDLRRDGNTVVVETDTSTGFSIGINIIDVELRLAVPERQYETLALDTGSGSVELSGLHVDGLTMDGGSGNLRLNGIEAKDVDVEIGSGNINGKDVKADTVKLKTGSGNIELERIAAGEMSAHTSSGNVRLLGADGKITAKTGSGNVRAELAELKQPIDIETGSGNVAIATDAKPASASVKFTTGSGDFDNEWDGAEQTRNGRAENIVFGGGETTIRVATGSGDCSLERR